MKKPEKRILLSEFWLNVNSRGRNKKQILVSRVGAFFPTRIQGAEKVRRLELYPHFSSSPAKISAASLSALIFSGNSGDLHMHTRCCFKDAPYCLQMGVRRSKIAFLMAADVPHFGNAKAVVGQKRHAG